MSVLLALLALADVARAQEKPDGNQPLDQPAGQPAGQAVDQPEKVQPAPQAATVTRTDLARAYLAFDRAFVGRRKDLSDAQVEEFNRAFDRASVGFFSGQFGPTVRTLRELRLRLARLPEAGEAEAPLAEHVRAGDVVWSSLIARVEPEVLTDAQIMSGCVPTLRVASFAPVDAGPARTVRWTLFARPMGSSQRSMIELPPVALAGGAEGGAGGGVLAFEVPVEQLAGLAPGTYALELVDDQFRTLEAGSFTRAGEALEDLRRPLDAALTAASADHAELARSIAIARARLDLLRDESAGTRSARDLANVGKLFEQVRSEVTELSKGRDPYPRLGGDWWGVLPPAEGEREGWPLRIVAPGRTDGERLRTSEGPFPLVIALHGAGGDESMFPEAYGGGVIARLARLHGFILASPAATGLSPARFDRLLAHLKSLYPIDETRIYVVGHSMGAGLASGLARSHADKLAAVACLAGGRFGAVRAGATYAPVLMLGAKLDPIIPAARLEPDAQRARDLGVPVDYRTMPAWGHTLMVGEALPAAIDWLLAQRLAPRTPIPARERPEAPQGPKAPPGNPPTDPPANDRNPDGVPAPEPLIHPTPRPPGL